MIWSWKRVWPWVRAGFMAVLRLAFGLLLGHFSSNKRRQFYSFFINYSVFSLILQSNRERIRWGRGSNVVAKGRRLNKLLRGLFKRGVLGTWQNGKSRFDVERPVFWGESALCMEKLARYLKIVTMSLRDKQLFFSLNLIRVNIDWLIGC